MLSFLNLKTEHFGLQQIQQENVTVISCYYQHSALLPLNTDLRPTSSDLQRRQQICWTASAWAQLSTFLDEQTLSRPLRLWVSPQFAAFLSLSKNVNKVQWQQSTTATYLPPIFTVKSSATIQFRAARSRWTNLSEAKYAIPSAISPAICSIWFRGKGPLPTYSTRQIKYEV